MLSGAQSSPIKQRAPIDDAKEIFDYAKGALGAYKVRPDGSIATEDRHLNMNNQVHQVNDQNSSGGYERHPSPIKQLGTGLGNAGINSPNGVGVTYSNVLLGGGINPNSASGNVQSSYNAGYNQAAHGNVQHKTRFIDPKDQRSIQTERNQYSYVKGVEFNPAQKYDYNILNGQSMDQANAQQQRVLQRAGNNILQ